MRSVGAGDIYRHFEGDSFYIIGIARDQKTNQESVVYHSIDGYFTMYTMPIKDFVAEVPHNSNNPTQQKYCFELVSQIKTFI